jgi:hypothetical protein
MTTPRILPNLLGSDIHLSRDFDLAGVPSSRARLGASIRFQLLPAGVPKTVHFGAFPQRLPA